MADQNSQQTEQVQLDPQEIEAAQGADIVEDNAIDRLAPQSHQLEREDKPSDERQHAKAPDSKRADIAKSFRRENSRPFEDMNDDNTTYGNESSRPGEEDDDEGAVLEGAPTEPADEKSADEQSADEQDQSKKRYVVNGEEKWLTEDEVTRIVQKNLNADKVTQEAKAREADLTRRFEELEQRINARSDSSERPAGQQSPTSPEAQQQDEQSVDDAEGLAEIAEALQVGDTEEAAKALQRLEQRLRTGQTLNPADIIRTVREDDDQKADRVAFQEFATATPEFKSDDVIQSRMYAAALDAERISDIVTAAQKLGQDPDMVRSNLSQRNSSDIATLHREMRLSGHAPRAHADVYKAAYGHIAKGQAQPSGVNISEERQRRAASSQPQPAARGRPTQTQTERPKTRADVVADMRKARGQAV